MSVTLMSLVFYADGLTHIDKSVLLALADHASDDGYGAYPSVKTLMIKTALSERTVRASLKSLRSEEVGIIEVVRESTHNFPTQYRIVWEKLVDMQSEYGRQKLTNAEKKQSRGAGDAPIGVQDTHPRGAGDAPNPSVNHHINHHTRVTQKDNARTGQKSTNDQGHADYKDRIALATAKGIISGGDGVDHFPEEERLTIATFCKLNNFSPPRYSRGTKSEYAQWVRDSRDFREACGDVSPVDVLKRIRANFVEYMSTHGGIAPFRVLSIRSLVKSARQAAGELRQQAAKADMPTTFYY